MAACHHHPPPLLPLQVSSPPSLSPFVSLHLSDIQQPPSQSTSKLDELLIRARNQAATVFGPLIG